MIFTQPCSIPEFETPTQVATVIKGRPTFRGAGGALDVMSTRAFWLGSFAFAMILFGLTSHMGHVRVNDTDAANVPAWWFVHHGTFFLNEFKAETHSNNPWFISVGTHVVSNRTAGIILFGLPAQAVFAKLSVSANAIGSFTALLASASTVANVAILLRRLGNSRAAAAAAIVFATGTGVWTVASAELWPHTADLFWISCALLAIQRNQTLLGGVLLAPLVATRPHLAIVVAVMGLWLAASRSSMRVLAHFALPAVAAVAGLVLWNNLLYGSPSITGGYAGMVDELPGHGSVLWRMVINVAGVVGSPMRGVLLYSPVVVIFVICLVRGWRPAPDWARAAFVGGVCYEIIQLRLNRYSGGIGFYSSRLILEPLILGCPLAYLGFLDWRFDSAARGVATRALATASIGIHAIGAFCTQSYMLHPQSWATWGPVAAISYQPVPAITLLVMSVALGSFITLWPLRRRSTASQPSLELAAAATG